MLSLCGAGAGAAVEEDGLDIGSAGEFFDEAADGGGVVFGDFP